MSAPAQTPGALPLDDDGDARPLLAIGLMVTASFSYAAMGATVKWAGELAQPLWTIVGVRSIVLVAIIAAMMRVRRIAWRPGNGRAIAARSIAGFVAMACYFYALTISPLANAVTIQWTSPLFVALFGALILRERLTPIMLGCSVVALGGVVLIVDPDLSVFDVGSIFAVVSAVLAGFAYVFVRQMRNTDPPERIVGWFGLVSLVASIPFMIAEGVPWPSPMAWLALAGAGVSAFGGQIFMTWAYRYGEAAFVSAFSYATVLVSAGIGFVAFAEIPGWHEVLGAVLIVAAGIVLSWQKTRR